MSAPQQLTRDGETHRAVNGAVREQLVSGRAAAAELAARIQVPRRLPPRYDGQPLQHLSHSSYARFVLCPESWRRYYVCGERSAPTGSMFLGRRVDEAITLYYRRILEHGDRLSLDQVKTPSATP